MQLCQQSEMPLCLFLLGDEKLKRFAGNPAGLPGYTIVQTNNVLLEATEPEQTNQSGGGGVVGSWKQSFQESPPFLLLCKLSHPDPNSGWWRACCRGGAVNCPRPTSCPTCGAKCPCWRQPWAQEAMNWRSGCVTNAQTPCSCVFCRVHHVPLSTLWAGLCSLSTPAPSEGSCLPPYKCMWSRGRSQQAHIDNHFEYTARVLAWCTSTKGNKILGCIKGTIPEDGKTNILISGCGETSVSQFWSSLTQKINSNSNVSWEKLSRMRRRMKNQNIKELVSFSLANGHREGDNYLV